MAKIRAKTPEQLAALRIDGADLLVATWLARQVAMPRGAHWDQCCVDLTLSDVSFGVGVGGGCATCAYVYDEAALTVRCSCGARSRRYDIDISGRGQGAILAELRALATELDTPVGVADDAAEAVDTAVEDLADTRAELEDRIWEDRSRLDD